MDEFDLNSRLRLVSSNRRIAIPKGNPDTATQLLEIELLSVSRRGPIALTPPLADEHTKSHEIVLARVHSSVANPMKGSL